SANDGADVRGVAVLEMWADGQRDRAIADRFGVGVCRTLVAVPVAVVGHAWNGLRIVKAGSDPGGRQAGDDIRAPLGALTFEHHAQAVVRVAQPVEDAQAVEPLECLADRLEVRLPACEDLRDSA